MMFEAFGFSRAFLRCRNLSQLPSGPSLWWEGPLFLTFSLSRTSLQNVSY